MWEESLSKPWEALSHWWVPTNPLSWTLLLIFQRWPAVNSALCALLCEAFFFPWGCLSTHWCSKGPANPYRGNTREAQQCCPSTGWELCVPTTSALQIIHRSWLLTHPWSISELFPMGWMDEGTPRVDSAAMPSSPLSDIAQLVPPKPTHRSVSIQHWARTCPLGPALSFQLCWEAPNTTTY